MPSEAASVLMALGEKQIEAESAAQFEAECAALVSAAVGGMPSAKDPEKTEDATEASAPAEGEAGGEAAGEAAGGAAGEAAAAPENLELRANLETFRGDHDPSAARLQLGNAVKVLGRLKQEPENTKLHEMRRDLLDKIVGEPLFCIFLAAGFEDRGAVMSWRGRSPEDAPEALQSLGAAFAEAQRASDLSLDPESVTFAQVSELVQQGRTLPGIQTVSDGVSEPVAAKDSSMDRPKKPWET